MKNLNCVGMGQDNADCPNPVNRMDVKGFIYCEVCGTRRKLSGIRCRKLKPKELKQLMSGLPLERY